MTFTPEQLQERTLHRRAIEAAIWGIPAVNYEMMSQALVRDAKGAPNQIVYWSRLLDGKNQTLTPNPDAIYLMPFYDTTNGPVVLEIPPADDGSITGSIDDAWQCAIADVGPAGTDAGKGGKYLILPPDYRDSVPDGYISMNSPTYCGYASTAVQPQERQRLGHRRPLLHTGNGSSSIRWVRRASSRTPRSSTPPTSCSTPPSPTMRHSSRHSTDRVQVEPWLTRDKAMINQLKSIGIEKGRPFSPDAASKDILSEAMQEVHAWLDDVTRTAFRRRSTTTPDGRFPAHPSLSKPPPTDSAIETPTPSTTEEPPIPGRSSAPNTWVQASTT